MPAATPVNNASTLHQADFSVPNWRDPSLGHKNMAYGVDVHVEPEILNLLCPKGTCLSVQRQLGDAVLNVLALPGKHSVSRSVTMCNYEENVSAVCLREMMGSPSMYKDHTWQSPSRNTIHFMTSLDLLHAKSTEI